MTLDIHGQHGEVKRILPVRDNGYLEDELLLPETLGAGTSQFVITGSNNKIIVKKLIVLINPE